MARRFALGPRRAQPDPSPSRMQAVTMLNTLQPIVVTIFLTIASSLASAQERLPYQLAYRLVAQEGDAATQDCRHFQGPSGYHSSTYPSTPSTACTIVVEYYCPEDPDDGHEILGWQADNRQLGHTHTNDGRDIGSWSPVTSPGPIATTYDVPENALSLVTTVVGINTCTLPVDFKVAVQEPGLQRLLSGTHYNVVGETSSHPSNHWGLAALNTKLVTLADSVAAKYPTQKLKYNDMGLIWGGLFDIGPPTYGDFWQPPHNEHRKGRNADVAILLSQAKEDHFKAKAAELNLIVLEETLHPHYHLSLP